MASDLEKEKSSQNQTFNSALNQQFLDYRPLYNGEHVLQVPVRRSMNRSRFDSCWSYRSCIVFPCAPGIIQGKLLNYRNVIFQYIDKVVHIKYIHEGAAEKNTLKQTFGLTLH